MDCELAIETNISARKLADLLKALIGSERKDYWRHDVGCASHYAEKEGAKGPRRGAGDVRHTPVIPSD